MQIPPELTPEQSAVVRGLSPQAGMLMGKLADEVGRLRAELSDLCVSSAVKQGNLLGALMDFYTLHAESDWRVPDEKYHIVMKAAAVIQEAIRETEPVAQQEGV